MAALMSLALPRRFLRGSYGPAVLALGALTCGVGLICAMELVNRAVLRAFTEVVDTVAGRAALTVSAGTAAVAETLADEVAAVPGVELAVPVVSSAAFLADGNGEALTVHGIDVANDAALEIYEANGGGGLELDEPLAFLGRADSIAITGALAAARGLTIGDPLELLTPRGRQRFRVRAILAPRGIARVYGASLVVMDLAAAERAFLADGLVNRIDVVVRRDADVGEVADRIARMLPPGVHVERPEQRKADLHRVMGSLRLMLSALSLVGVAAAFFIILNRLTAILDTRRWQLGVLRAVGMRGRRIWWELLKEAGLFGVIAVALGIPLGIGVGRMLLPVVAATAALNYKLVAADMQLGLEPAALAMAVVLGIGTAVLAAALPAWRVARRPPIESIRERGLSAATVGLRSAAVVLLTAVALGAVLADAGVGSASHRGLAATVLLVALTGLLARPLLPLTTALVVPLLRARIGASALVARGTFRRNGRRAILTIGMIGVGMGAVIWLRTLAYSFEVSLVHALSGALQGDWVVTSAHVTHAYMEAPLDEHLRDEMERLEGVGAAIAERMLDWHHAGGPIALDVFDGAYFRTTAFGRWSLIGSAQGDVWDAVGAGRAVLVSSSFAHNLGAAVGDTIELETPGGPVAVAVAGITTNFSSPRGTVIFARELYARHWNDPLVTRVYVRVAPGIDPLTVRRAIARDLGPTYGLRIISARELIDYFASAVHRAFAPVDVLAALLFVVLAIGLGDTLAAGVRERRRDLAVMRALGARRTVLRNAVVAETVGIAVPGVLLAVAAGTALGVLWIRRTFPALLGWALETHLPVLQIAALGALTIAGCGMAGLLPARRAGALHPAEALRYE